MATAIDIEKIDWEDAVNRIDWRQGEHTTLIGPTGRGKTELTIELLKFRQWVVFFGTKRIDPTQDELKSMDYLTVKSAHGINPDVSEKIILRPPFPRGASADSIKSIQREVFREGLMTCFRQTGWTVAMDEARYVTHFLGLEKECSLIWLQGRSQGNSVICNVQRPRFVPLEAYDQATHIFLWTDNDRSNVQRTSELAGFNRRNVIQAFREMEMHDVLYINTVTNDMFITNTRW